MVNPGSRSSVGSRLVATPLMTLLRRSVLLAAITLPTFTLPTFTLPALVSAQECRIAAHIPTQNNFSSEFIDEVTVIGGDVRPLALVGRIHDINNDGIREVLSFEQGNRVYLRSGADLSSINTGAFPFTLPNGAVPTQLSSIGDLELDGAEEFAIGLRYRGQTSGQSSYVFSGTTRNVIQSFPAIISGLPQKYSDDQPGYVNPPFVSRLGVTAQITTVSAVRRVVYGDPHQNGGILVFRTTCQMIDNPYPCFDVRSLGNNSEIARHNLFASMVGVDVGNSRSLLIADPSADSLPRNFPGSNDVRKNLAGAVVRFVSDSYGTVIRGLYPSARTGYQIVRPLGPIMGHQTVLITAPHDGLVDGATGTFEVRTTDLLNMLSYFTPGILDESADLGFAIDGGVDLTSDGVTDVAVSAPGEGGTGKIRVYTPTTNDDKAVRLILGYDGATQRFGHSLAVVGTGKIVTADLNGNLMLLSTSGARIGSSTTTMCSVNGPAPTPTPGAQSALIQELLDRSRSVSTRLGTLNLHQGRSSHNTPILNSIKSNTDRIKSLLGRAEIRQVEPRINAAFRERFTQRSTRLQNAYRNGRAAQRREARRNLVSQSNNISAMMRAAQQR